MAKQLKLLHAKGEKLRLNMTRILSLLFSQSVALESAVEPVLKEVSVRAITPSAIMKIIKITTKMMPNDPILIKRFMSFLLQIITKTTKRARET